MWVVTRQVLTCQPVCLPWVEVWGTEAWRHQTRPSLEQCWSVVSMSWHQSNSVMWMNHWS